MLEKKVVDLSDYRLQKAKNLLVQAELLFKNQMFDGSINSSYYAVFNAIRSLLSLVELDSNKHSGALSYFDQFFVKTSIFDKRFRELLIPHLMLEVIVIAKIFMSHQRLRLFLNLKMRRFLSQK